MTFEEFRTFVWKMEVNKRYETPWFHYKSIHIKQTMEGTFSWVMEDKSGGIRFPYKGELTKFFKTEKGAKENLIRYCTPYISGLNLKKDYEAPEAPKFALRTTTVLLPEVMYNLLSDRPGIVLKRDSSNDKKDHDLFGYIIEVDDPAKFYEIGKDVGFLIMMSVKEEVS